MGNTERTASIAIYFAKYETIVSSADTALSAPFDWQFRYKYRGWSIHVCTRYTYIYVWYIYRRVHTRLGYISFNPGQHRSVYRERTGTYYATG